MSDLFSLLLIATWKGSLVIILVWGLRRVFFRNASPGLRYALWGVVWMRLLLPTGPASELSVFPLAEAAWQSLFLDGDLAVPSVQRGVASLSSKPSSAVIVASALYSTLALAWIAGIVLLSAWYLYQWVRLKKLLRRASTPIGDELSGILKECIDRIGLRRPVALLLTEELRTPAVTGTVRPVILLPRKLAQSLEGSEIRHVLYHELSHIQRWDVAAHAVARLVRTLHWFNPLVLLAERLTREDRELACDAKTLSRLPANERARYARTLVRVAEEGSGASVPAHLSCLAGTKGIQRRIEMVSNARRTSGTLWAGQLALAIAIAFTALTDGAVVLAATNALPEQLGVDVVITPAEEGDYICALKLTDLENGKVVAAPTIRFSASQPAQLTIGSADGTRGWKVDVATDDEQSSVRLTISVMDEGVEKIVHQMSVSLHRISARNRSSP